MRKSSPFLLSLPSQISLVLQMAVVAAVFASTAAAHGASDSHAQLMQLVDQNAAHWKQVSKQIWDYAELGYHETKSSDLLEEQCVEVKKGDVIVLYTDGITEAMNQNSDLFGDARLGRIIAEHGHLDAADLRERILSEIEAFVGAADQHDDMTMILIKVEEAAVGRARVAV